MVNGDGRFQLRLDELSMPTPVRLSHPPTVAYTSSNHTTV